MGIYFDIIITGSDVFADLQPESQFIELMSNRSHFISLCTPFSTKDDMYYICNNTHLRVYLMYLHVL